MDKKQNAILMGPFVGEFYWDIVLTREERFDLYGKYADILVPLRIPGDYKEKIPECFRLKGLKLPGYEELAQQFKNKYKNSYNIMKHVYPNLKKPHFQNKNQYRQNQMLYKFAPRKMNYDLVKRYLPNDKPLVVLAPRYRKGFKRNWKHWNEFYNKIAKDRRLLNDFHFIICGKKGEYLPDPEHRFLDMNDIKLKDGASLVGLLLVILENASFVFGSQSAIPNIGLLYEVEVLAFGCQKSLHTRTYNVKNAPITFIENRKYNIDPGQMHKKMKSLLYQKKEKYNAKTHK
jgi:hypothetical protein